MYWHIWGLVHFYCLFFSTIYHKYNVFVVKQLGVLLLQVSQKYLKKLRYKIGSLNKSVSYPPHWLYNDQLPTLSVRMCMICTCSMSFLSLVRKFNKVQLIWVRRCFIGRTTGTCIQFQKLLKSIPCICYDQENRLTWGHIKMSHNLR